MQPRPRWRSKRVVRDVTAAAQQCIIRVAHSKLVARVAAWLASVGRRVWLRRLRATFARASSFLVGSTFVDEELAFSKALLVKNDAYRDRLLENEIADLVDLCDALRMTLAQRKSLFRTFLHLDFMRRSTIARHELLRYCNLRACSLTAFLLPLPAVATHRPTAHRRWDISQVFAACFSICTADSGLLVYNCITEALRAGRWRQQRNEEAPEPADWLPAESSLAHDLKDCVEFFIGVPTVFEAQLVEFLKSLYGRSRERGGAQDDELVDFRLVHQVESVVDVAQLFPALVFPCIWTQHVLRVRTLGAATWGVLQRRRDELEPPSPSEPRSLFLSFSDIITLAAGSDQQNTKSATKSGTVSAWLSAALSPKPTLKGASSDKKRREPLVVTPLVPKKHSDRSHSSSGRTSTPRKVLPVETPVPRAGSSVLTGLSNMAHECSTHASAWRVTANNILASAYVKYRVEAHHSEPSGGARIPHGVKNGDEELCSLFAETVESITTGTLAKSECQRLYDWLVRCYGYQFAREVFVKSSMRESAALTKATPEEKRARDRYTKAWSGSELPDDHVRYWKQFDDPLTSQAFYYNIRTGESQWERPLNVAATAARGKRRRRKKA